MPSRSLVAVLFVLVPCTAAVGHGSRTAPLGSRSAEPRAVSMTEPGGHGGSGHEGQGGHEGSGGGHEGGSSGGGHGISWSRADGR